MTSQNSTQQEQDVIRLTVRMPAEEHELLRRVAFETRTPMNDIVCDAFRASMPKLRKKLEAVTASR